MSDTGNDIQASFPVPPPVGKLPIVDRNGYLLPNGLITLQLMWAALQGAGGLLDIALIDLPNAGVGIAQAESVLAAAMASMEALFYPAGQLAALESRVQQAEDLARALLGRPSAGSSTSAAVPSSASLVTSQALVANNLVNVWNDGAAFHARKADATAAIGALHEAHGFVTAAYAMGAAATVQFFGFVTGLSGLTPGPAYLGAAGAVTSTPNSTSGQVSQQVGIAVSATTMWFAPQPPQGL